jgi:hypothetical protein
MPTTIDLTLGINLTIGSVPVALQADIKNDESESVYTFNGCIQDAEIPLGRFLTFVGEQFKVSVELPPELNLSAKIDYLAGQMIYTKPKGTEPRTTELGVSCKFDLTVKEHAISFQFFASVVLASPEPETGNPYVIGASIEKKLAFADLPLVGRIPGFKDLTLTNIGFSYTNAESASFNIPQVAKKANPLYTRKEPSKESYDYSITSDGPKRTFDLSSKGFALTAGLINSSTGETANSFALPLKLPAATPPPTPAPAKFAPDKTSPPNSSVHWIEINKTFGPVDLKQIGLNYSGGAATFGFSAGFALGGFSLDLEGMSITFPLPGNTEATPVRFNLDGLGFNIKRGSFEMGGAFLKVQQENVTSYFGEAIVKVGTFGIKALGGYTPEHEADVNGVKVKIPASFFLYANLKAPLGGPPFLFVTGLAGGFGINNQLNLPTIDELPGFILLPSEAPEPQGSPSKTIAKVLPQFQKHFKDLPGQYWIAAGVSFTSFQMIDAFALVTVSFGVEFQVALLGTCSMKFPKLAPVPVAYIEIQILASFTPSVGLLAVDGRLSPASFIYGGFVRLTGGFAFYIWFGGAKDPEKDHKGEFVVSVGGYHPGFRKPLYYPTVPRLGISAGLGPFQITGQAYFALTPSMMMAGIAMSATWSSGIIKAWLEAGVDFLIAWAPFHYEAGAYITVGCSVNLGLFTLNVSIGAELMIWGPPFGGKATVDLSVVSFTISFGAKQELPSPVDWSTFRDSFLPSNSKNPVLLASGAAAPDIVNVVKASVEKGLLGTYDGDKWLIDPDNFAIETNSTIPSNIAQWWLTPESVDKISNTPSDYGQKDAAGLFLKLPPDKPFSEKYVWKPTLNIGPMGQKGVKSYHKVELFGTKQGEAITSVSVQPLLLDTSSALWATAEESGALNAEQLQKKTLVGFAITPIPRLPNVVSGVPLDQLLFGGGFSTTFSYTAAEVTRKFTVSSELENLDLIIRIAGGHTEEIKNTGMALKALDEPWVRDQRRGILDDLRANGFETYPSSSVDLKEMAKKALMNWPVVELLGANK